MQIEDGTSPKKVLKERGIDYDQVGFLPELPDYLGYFLGVLLIWLVYTGYSSVVAVIKNPQATVSRVTESVQRAAKTAVPALPDQNPREEAFADKIENSIDIPKSEEAKESKSWTRWLSLKKLNNAVSDTISSIPSYVSGIFSEDEGGANVELQGEKSSSSEAEGHDSLDRF